MINEKALEAHYGEAWSHVRGLLVEASKFGVWEVLRKQNLVSTAESLNSDQDPSELAKEIIQRRQENRMLLALESQFTS